MAHSVAMRVANSRVKSDVLIVGQPTSLRCRVHVGGESVTLVFERLSSGRIWMTGQEREYDGVERVSRASFMAALKLARQKMNEMLIVETRKCADAQNKIIVDSSSTTECILLYGGWRLSFTIEAADTPVWNNVHLAAKSDDRLRAHPLDDLAPLPQLLDDEFRALKMRALGTITARRRIEVQQVGDRQYREQLEDLEPKFL